MAWEPDLGLERLLTSGQPDSRSQAGVQIEKNVRQALLNSDGQGRDDVFRVINWLKNRFLEQPETRSGLFGLSSVGLGLDAKINDEEFLTRLVEPVVDLFWSGDHRVRYYAAEALFNISKVAQSAILSKLPWSLLRKVFEGICQLAADTDVEVKAGASMLDRELKDIVSLDPLNLDIVKFVAVLAEKVSAQNPNTRQLVLAWIHFLVKNRTDDMVNCLPQYLEELLEVLGDQARSPHVNAGNCLNELLEGLSKREDDQERILSETVEILIRGCSKPGARFTELRWLHKYIALKSKMTGKGSGKFDEKWVELPPMLLNVTLHCFEKKCYEKKEEHERGEQAQALREQEQKTAIDLNRVVLDWVSSLKCKIPVGKCVERLKRSMQESQHVDARAICLQWICVLLDHGQGQFLEQGTVGALLEPVFKTLLDNDDEVVASTLGVLAHMMEKPSRCETDPDEEDLFTMVTRQLLNLLRRVPDVPKNRENMIIRQLCGHLDPRRLYVTVVQCIHESDDFESSQRLVQSFNWNLFALAETAALREELRHTEPLEDRHRLVSGSGGFRRPLGESRGRRPLFWELLEAWFHNPVSTLALCLWAQQHELAMELTARLSTFEPTLDSLTQLDQLVYLIESPIFSQVRLQFLDPSKNPYLLRCVLGLAMLIPQASAFNILKARMSIVRAGLLLQSQPVDPPVQRDDSKTNADSFSFPWTRSGLTSSTPAVTASATTDGDEDASARLLKKFDAVAASMQ